MPCSTACCSIKYLLLTLNLGKDWLESVAYEQAEEVLLDQVLLMLLLQPVVVATFGGFPLYVNSLVVCYINEWWCIDFFTNKNYFT